MNFFAKAWAARDDAFQPIAFYVQPLSITTNQAVIIALFRVVNRYVGNLALMPGFQTIRLR